ncbi:MAG TPA: saccharopine dehydrogenase NADP-binding domain-containing protein, partial [Chitinophagaceae bacterium]
MRIAVLGAGMVGRAIAIDLAKNYSVTSFDLNAMNLEAVKEKDASIEVVPADLSLFNEYNNLLAPFDIVVTAVPGFLGYKTLEAVINAGKDVVDISFFPEDVLQLNKLAVA